MVVDDAGRVRHASASCRAWRWSGRSSSSTRWCCARPACWRCTCRSTRWRSRCGCACGTTRCRPTTWATSRPSGSPISWASKLRLVRFDPEHRRLSTEVDRRRRGAQPVQRRLSGAGGEHGLAGPAERASWPRPGSAPVGIERFRPNIVLAGIEAHDEDRLDVCASPRRGRGAAAAGEALRALPHPRRRPGRPARATRRQRHAAGLPRRRPRGRRRHLRHERDRAGRRGRGRCASARPATGRLEVRLRHDGGALRRRRSGCCDGIVLSAPGPELTSAASGDRRRLRLLRLDEADRPARARRHGAEQRGERLLPASSASIGRSLSSTAATWNCSVTSGLRPGSGIRPAAIRRAARSVTAARERAPSRITPKRASPMRLTVSTSRSSRRSLITLRSRLCSATAAPKCVPDAARG